MKLYHIEILVGKKWLPLGVKADVEDTHTRKRSVSAACRLAKRQLPYDFKLRLLTAEVKKTEPISFEE